MAIKIMNKKSKSKEAVVGDPVLCKYVKFSFFFF
jgi:hypothetical protein